MADSVTRFRCRLIWKWVQVGNRDLNIATFLDIYRFRNILFFVDFTRNDKIPLTCSVKCTYMKNICRITQEIGRIFYSLLYDTQDF